MTLGSRATLGSLGILKAKRIRPAVASLKFDGSDTGRSFNGGQEVSGDLEEEEPVQSLEGLVVDRPDPVVDQEERVDHLVGERFLEIKSSSNCPRDNGVMDQALLATQGAGARSRQSAIFKWFFSLTGIRW